MKKKIHRRPTIEIITYLIVIKYHKQMFLLININNDSNIFSASKINHERIYPCEKCDKAFNRKFSLNRHTKTCKGPKLTEKCKLKYI